MTLKKFTIEIIIRDDDGSVDRALDDVLDEGVLQDAINARFEQEDIFCAKCGDPCFVDDDEVTRHGCPMEIDNDADTDHVAVADEDVTPVVESCVVTHVEIIESPIQPAADVAARVPADWPVQPLAEGDAAVVRATCGNCGLSWSARCPFEYFHREG